MRYELTEDAVWDTSIIRTPRGLVGNFGLIAVHSWNSDTTGTTPVTDGKSPLPASIPRLVWRGDVPHQKWMNFYTKVLSKFATTAGLKLTLRVEVAPLKGFRRRK